MTNTQNKTIANDKSVENFISQVQPDSKRHDAQKLIDIMREQTGFEPTMWGDSIIGFGQYHYRYASGREGDWFLVGFSPRKQNISLYVMAGVQHFPDLLGKLGKHKKGKGCIYINKLDDINEEVLKELIKSSADYTETHQSSC